MEIAHKTMQQKAEEAKKCCKADFGSMLDNADRSLDFEFFYESQELAEQALAYYTSKAREVESEPCEICSQIDQTEQGWRLTARFVFSCQAELVLFQIKAR